jgi:Condensation domain/KR domain/Phosphopantetheine attachment site
VASDISNQMPSLARGKLFLIIGDTGDITSVLAQLLRVSNEVISVNYAEHFTEIDSFSFGMNIESEAHFTNLLSYLRDRNKMIDGVIFLNRYLPTIEATNIHDKVRKELMPFFYFCKVFGSQLERRNFYIGVVTNGIGDSEEELKYDNFGLWGFWKGILSDYPQLKMSVIDFSPPINAQELCDLLLYELNTDNTVRFVSYKNRKRRVQKLVTCSEILSEHQFRKQQTFVVSGGLGRIGRHLCRYLSKNEQNLIIIGTRSIENDVEAQQFISSISQNKAAIIYLNLELSNEAAVAECFHKLASEKKEIDGIFHLAGIADDWVPIAQKEESKFIRTINPKISGTLLLDKYTRDFEPEFFVCFSSLNSIIPKKNSFDYSAANSFEDFYCFKRGYRNTTKYIGINWPGWSVFDESNHSFSITPEKGILYLMNIISGKRSNYVISESEHLKLYSSNPFFKISNDDKTLDEEKNVVSFENLDSLSVEDVEVFVLRVWNKVLRTEEIALEDDFFEIGGHSLNGTQILNRINRGLNIDLDMDQLFENSTVLKLSEFIYSLLKSSPSKVSRETVDITPIPDAPFYAASSIQKNFWIMHNLQKGSRALNMVLPFFVKGLLDVHSFEQALKYVIERHESLRTNFSLIDGEICQTIISFDKLSFTLNLEVANSNETWQDFIQRERDLLFDLDDGPLFRTRLIQLKPDYFMFIFVVDHILIDGWSTNILLMEITKAYDSFYNGNQPQFEKLNFQYKDYVYWCERMLNKDNVAHKSFWLDKLHGEWPRLAVKYPDKKTGIAGTQEIKLDQKTTKRLKTIASDHDSTLFMVLMALIKITFCLKYRWLDITIATVSASRFIPELENQVGNFLNTLLIRDVIDIHEGFLSVLAKVKESNLEAQKHSLYPYARVVSDLLAEGREWREYWADVTVTLHNYVEVKTESEIETGNVIVEFKENKDKRDFDLDWNISFNCVDLRGGLLSIEVLYQLKYFSDADIEELNSCLLSVIDYALEKPTNQIEEMKYLHSVSKEKIF